MICCCGVVRSSQAHPGRYFHSSMAEDYKEDRYTVYDNVLFFVEICLLLRSDSPLVGKTYSDSKDGRPCCQILKKYGTLPRRCSETRGIRAAHSRTSTRGGHLRCRRRVVATRVAGATCTRLNVARGVMKKEPCPGFILT